MIYFAAKEYQYPVYPSGMHYYWYIGSSCTVKLWPCVGSCICFKVEHTINMSFCFPFQSYVSVFWVCPINHITMYITLLHLVTPFEVTLCLHLFSLLCVVSLSNIWRPEILELHDEHFAFLALGWRFQWSPVVSPHKESVVRSLFVFFHVFLFCLLIKQ